MVKILLIEDNPEIRESTSEILTLADYKVFEAENGKIGVEKAKEILPDLILCDIMMPELDGYGVLRILSKNKATAGIPFIFLSGKSEKSDLRRGMNLGADDYLIKPFEENDLLETIENRMQRNALIRKINTDRHNTSHSRYQNENKMDALKNLSKDKKEKTILKKEKIYHEGDYANYLYFVIEGKVKCYKTDTFGKEYVIEIIEPGNFFGYTTLFENKDYTETAVAMTDCIIGVISKQDFLVHIQHNNFTANDMIRMLTSNIREREKKLLQLAYSPVRERVADALLKHKEKSTDKNTNSYCTQISREDLAGIVGTSKESLVRILSDLKKEGIIESSGRTIRILDETSLKRTACGY